MPAVGQCSCFVGYGGPACGQCADGYALAGGLCQKTFNSFLMQAMLTGQNAGAVLPRPQVCPCIGQGLSSVWPAHTA